MAKTKKIKTKTKETPGDFKLSPEYYSQFDEFEVYKTEKKITKIFGVSNKSDNKNPYLKARTRSKKPYGWKYINGIDLHIPSQVAKFIQGLLQVADKLGWKVKQSENLEQLKVQLQESERTIVRLENSNQDWREKHEKLMKAFRKKQEQVLRSRVPEFKKDIASLAELIKKAEDNKVPEQDLQEFLYSHPWFLGTEYLNAEPQKLRGAHSKFDFYLERFNKTNDIVEIKLLSDQIVNKDNSLNAKVSQAVDQLIEYMESSQAAAHSRVISEEESIKELRPRGIVIIGSETSSKTTLKLQKWNYQFAHITILTYIDVLKRARTVLNHLQSKQKK